ncbi:uncharacterized protein V6R79_021155 [Siganus canaliculatus]
MADVGAVLQRCDPGLLESCRDWEQQDGSEAARMLLFLTDNRRVQKVLWRQLFVLDSTLSLLEGLKSAQQLMTQACPAQPEGGARGRWKGLKAEFWSGVEDTKTLLRSLQERVERIQTRRQKVTDLVQELTVKRQQCQEVGVSLLKAQNALQSCDAELKRLRVESEAAVDQLMSWQRIRDELQGRVSTIQDAMQINLLLLNQSEMCVELRPRPSSEQSANELEPLKLTVTWSHDDHFKLQVDKGVAGLPDDCLCGRRWELSAALLDVLRCYEGQFQLLLEIQGLRSSFAIDWIPGRRLLVYLKSALLVCHLEVEDGYPARGRARLQSVRRDGHLVDTSGLKPSKLVPSLTDWLVFLCSCSLL